MASQLNPLSRLSDDSSPLPWIAPTDCAPEIRRTTHISGVAGYLAELAAGARSAAPRVSETRLQIQQRRRQSRRSAYEAEHERQKAQWNPHKDPHIEGDPYATLIVARIRYSTTPEELSTVFSQFGHVAHVRVVPNRGYAFVAFNDPHAARATLHNTGGSLKIQGRRVIIDLERGRTQKSWLPRRLGGGLGGRFSLARQKEEILRAQQIQRGSKSYKRDVRGFSRPRDNSSRRDTRESTRRDTRGAQPMFDPRRSQGPSAPRPQPSNTGAPARPNTEGRALRQY